MLVGVGSEVHSEGVVVFVHSGVSAEISVLYFVQYETELRMLVGVVVEVH